MTTTARSIEPASLEMLAHNVIEYLLYKAALPRSVIPKVCLTLAGHRGGYVLDQNQSRKRNEPWCVEMLRQINHHLDTSILLLYWNEYSNSGAGAPAWSEQDNMYVAVRTRAGESMLATARLPYAMFRHGRQPPPKMAFTHVPISERFLPNPFAPPSTTFPTPLQEELHKIVNRTGRHFSEMTESAHLQPLTEWLQSTGA